MTPRRDVLLVCGGVFHDFDHVRLALLTALSAKEHIRVTVRDRYDSAALATCDALVSYTCNLIPDADQTRALVRWVQAGGRWLALHGTNSLVEVGHDNRVKTPPLPGPLFDLLGSQFLAHPAPGRVRVRPAGRHPLTEGIGPFFIEDEHYLQRHAPGNIVLLAADFAGATPLFDTADWPPSEHQTCYLRPHGQGAVLYLTPGHSRGRHDMAPLTAAYPFVERGAWVHPVFHDLLARAIRWLDRDPALEMPDA